MRNQKADEWIIVFETSIDGKDARVELRSEVDPMNSRETRKQAEQIARASFLRLSKKFNVNQKIKCVEIVKIKAPEPTPESVNNGH